MPKPQSVPQMVVCEAEAKEVALPQNISTPIPLSVDVDSFAFRRTFSKSVF